VRAWSRRRSPRHSHYPVKRSSDHRRHRAFAVRCASARLTPPPSPCSAGSASCSPVPWKRRRRLRALGAPACGRRNTTAFAASFTGRANVELFSRDLKETGDAFPSSPKTRHRSGHVLFDGGARASRWARLEVFQAAAVSAASRSRAICAMSARRAGRLRPAVARWRALLDDPWGRRRLMEGLGRKPRFSGIGRSDVVHLDRIFAGRAKRSNEGYGERSAEPLHARAAAAWLKLKRPLATLDVVVTAVSGVTASAKECCRLHLRGQDLGTGRQRERGQGTHGAD
jgi:hypothetical protein